jgi:hypothetical protein
VSDEDLNEQTTLLSSEDEKIEDGSVSTIESDGEQTNANEEEKSEKVSEDSTDGVAAVAPSTTLIEEESNLSDATTEAVSLDKEDSSVTDKEEDGATGAVTNVDESKESVNEEATSADLGDTNIITLSNDNGNNKNDDITSTEMSATEDDESSGDTSVSFDPSLEESKRIFLDNNRKLVDLTLSLGLNSSEISFVLDQQQPKQIKMFNLSPKVDVSILKRERGVP